MSLAKVLAFSLFEIHQVSVQSSFRQEDHRDYLTNINKTKEFSALNSSVSFGVWDY